MLVFKDHPVQTQESYIPASGKASKGNRKPAWMSKDLLIEPGHEMELYMNWSRDRQNKRSIELLFDLARTEVRKAKADMELSLARDQKGNKKGF